MTHGTESCYAKGCRFAACRQARRDHDRRRRRKVARDGWPLPVPSVLRVAELAAQLVWSGAESGAEARVDRAVRVVLRGRREAGA